MLLELFNKSSKHNAIVLGKVNYIIGNGMKASNGRELDEINKPNKYESWKSIERKAAIDIEAFGGVYLELHWNALKQIGAVYHVPYINVRSSKDNKQFFVKDWTKDVRKEPEAYNCFNPELPEGKQILYFKEYRPGLETYTYPGYVGALNAIKTDVEISKYHLSTITNGMFSSKLINFNQGVPSEEEQKEVEKKFKRKFTGADNAGNIVVTFNDDPAKAPSVLDLSATDLDKHFDVLEKNIQQNIVTGHQVTSPMLFGIRVEGQLGGRSEMLEAYEIFKNTYVNDKQHQLEELFTSLLGYMGVQTELTIIPVEPIGYTFSEQTLLQIAPKEWLLEKAGIDVAKYPSTAPAPEAVPGGPVNENLKNLTGRQWQNVSRIIRNFENGKISQEQAKLLLQSSLGLTEEECNTMLSIDNNMEFTAQEKDELLIAEFAACGVNRDEYSVVQSKVVHSFAAENFAEITALETSVLDLIQKDKRITPEVISSVLKQSVEDVTAVMKVLEDDGVLSTTAKRVGTDIIIERTLAKPLSKITDRKPRTLEYKIMYSYEGPKDSRNRDFCRRLLDLNRFYSRADIETISRRLGYSVWDRRGGWWTQPDGTRSVSCRHNWKSNIVIKKK
jgi:DNA-binding Lrp family transcriptional regulator